MKRAVELERKLHSLGALGEAFGAMKSLSAHHFREAREAVAPARTYRDGVERMLVWSGAAIPSGDGAAGLLILGAELGLCGSYNSRLIEVGALRRAELGRGPTFCVGQRAATLLKRRKVDVDKTYHGLTSVRGITGLLLKLAEDVLTAFAHENLSSFDVVSSRFGGVGAASPSTLRLLPIEASATDGRRLARYVSHENFAGAVIREYLYVTLYQLLLDSLASEHGARLVATQAAETWLDERTAQLHRQKLALRREAGTQETIEIATGARVRPRNG